MKKFILVMVASFVTVLSANAQIATEKSTALDNIGFGVTAGVSTPLDFNSVFPLNLNAGVKVTKDFTPIFGVQAEGIAVLNDNHFSDLKTTVKATNVGLNGIFNFTNIFNGYRGTPRPFEVSTVTGLGWLHAWNTSENFLTAKTGLDLAFNLGKKKAHSIVVTPAVYWNLNKFGDVHFNKHNAQLAINLSYIYHFNTSNGTHHFKTYDVGAMIDEINRLNGALDECEKRDQKVVEKIVEKVVVQEAATTNSFEAAPNCTYEVSFAKNSTELSETAMKVLDNVKGKVKVFGYASPDGDKDYNLKLSQARADAVAKYLITKDVIVLSSEGKGVVGKYSTRSALIHNVE